MCALLLWAWVSATTDLIRSLNPGRDPFIAGLTFFSVVAAFSCAFNLFRLWFGMWARRD